MPKYDHFHVERYGEVSVMQIDDVEIVDRLAVSDWKEQMLEYVKAEKPQKLVVNLERVSRFSSENIGALIRLRDWVLGTNGQVKLCNLSGNVREVFQISKLDGTLFDIYDSTAEAIESF